MNQYGCLVEVQRLDSEIAVIDRTLGQLPETAALADARARLRALEARVAGLAEDLHGEQRAQTRIEQDVATVQDKIDREQVKLMSGSITSPKELAALQHEIQSLGGHRDALETSLLEQMEKTDAVAAQLAEVEALTAKARETGSAAAAAHDTITGELGGRRSDLAAERAAAAANIEAPLMARYEKFRQQFRGVAVGKLEGDTCGACRVDLPDLDLKRIRASDDLDRCPECRRLLVSEHLLKA